MIKQISHLQIGTHCGCRLDTVIVTPGLQAVISNFDKKFSEDFLISTVMSKESPRAGKVNGCHSNSPDDANNNKSSTRKDVVPPPSPTSRPKFVFRCQQAEGSPTGLISGFSNVKELYQKLSECYEFPVEDVSFKCRPTK